MRLLFLAPTGHPRWGKNVWILEIWDSETQDSVRIKNFDFAEYLSDSALVSAHKIVVRVLNTANQWKDRVSLPIAQRFDEDARLSEEDSRDNHSRA